MELWEGLELKLISEARTEKKKQLTFFVNKGVAFSKPAKINTLTYMATSAKIYIKIAADSPSGSWS